MEKILVTGGTGSLGSEVVRQLISLGCNVGVFTSRRDPQVPDGVGVFHGDLSTGEGLAEALAGVRTVIHCASNFSSFKDTDIGGTGKLLDTVDTSRPPHVVYISIVGIGKSVYPYYVAKRAVEEMLLGSGVPCTILRTTQFHDFVLNMIRTVLESAGEIALVPDGIRFQSVDIREVAGELIRIGGAKPAGLLPDFGGPEVLRFEDMFEEYVGMCLPGREWKIAPVAGMRYDNFRTGINIVPGHRSGKISWKEFLRSKF